MVVVEWTCTFGEMLVQENVCIFFGTVRYGIVRERYSCGFSAIWFGSVPVREDSVRRKKEKKKKKPLTNEGM